VEGIGLGFACQGARDISILLKTPMALLKTDNAY
jgi:hypothetical protein